MFLFDLILAILIFFACFLLGEKWVKHINIDFYSFGEKFTFCSLLGIVAIGLITTLLAFFHLIFPQTGWTLLTLIFLTSISSIKHLFKQAWQRMLSSRQKEETYKIPLSFKWFLSVVLTLLVLSSLSLALAPPVKTDALVYHLAIPKTYFEFHGIVNLPNNMYSFFPMLFSMIFLFAMTFGVESLPALLGLGTGFLLLTGLVLYYKNHLKGKFYLLVPILFFSIPTFWEISASAYVDIPLATLIFFAFYAWDLWISTDQKGWFYLMIIFGASAWATKLTAVIVLPLIVLGIAWKGKNHQNLKKVLYQLGIFAVVVLIFMGPWWMRNYFYSGNPFTPLFMQFLGGSDQVNWDSNRALMMNQYVKSFGMGRSLTDFFLLPYNLTFHSEPNSLKFDGWIGKAHFLLFPMLFGLWGTYSQKIKSMAAVFGVLIIFWFSYFQYVRFLTPSFTLLTLMLVYGLESTLRSVNLFKISTIIRSTAFILTILGVSYNISLVGELWWKINPVNFLAGKETKEQYLTRNISVFPMYQEMNKKISPNSKVLFIFMRNLGYLAERKFISDSVFEAHTMQKLLQRISTPKDLASRLKKVGVTHLMFDYRYVWGNNSAFSLEEQTLLRQFLDDWCKKLSETNSLFLFEVMPNPSHLPQI